MRTINFIVLILMFCFIGFPLKAQEAGTSENKSTRGNRKNVKPLEGNDPVEKHLPDNKKVESSSAWLSDKNTIAKWNALEKINEEDYWKSVSLRKLNLQLKSGVTVNDAEIQNFFKKYKLSGKLNNHFRGYKTLFILKVKGKPNKNRIIEIISDAKNNVPGIYLLEPISNNLK